METTWSMYDTHVTPHTPYNTLYTVLHGVLCSVLWILHIGVIWIPRSETPDPGHPRSATSDRTIHPEVQILSPQIRHPDLVVLLGWCIHPSLYSTDVHHVVVECMHYMYIYSLQEVLHTYYVVLYLISPDPAQVLRMGHRMWWPGS